MLPPVIPIFPLPNVVLFPNVLLPLHIFEPRYRALLAEALRGDRIIGMTLLQPGWQAAAETERPRVYPIGCAGVITHVEPLPDGRSDIVLRGVAKFRITGEPDTTTPYRVASVETVHDITTADDRGALREMRRRLEMLVLAALAAHKHERQFPPGIADEDLVNALSQYLDLTPLERQALLECASPLIRSEMLLELLEMKVLVERNGRVEHVH
jgi:Lon protease-like protein